MYGFYESLQKMYFKTIFFFVLLMLLVHQIILHVWECFKKANHEYLTDEKILPSNRRQIIEQAKFACSPLASFKKANRKTGWCYKVPTPF